MFDQTYSGDAAIAASQSVKERKYWLEKLSGELVKSSFPYDNNESISAVSTVSAARVMERMEICFRDELFSRLITISNQSDTRLLTVLAAGLMGLLAKYTGSRDIIIGMPIYKQKVTGDFINTVVPLRCQIQENLTFKNLLYQVKQIIDEAVKHQNYPLKTLLYDLNLPFSGHDFPLFDNILIMKNIQDPSYSQHIPVNIEFIFFRTSEYLEVTVQYNRLVYDQETIKRITGHFSQLLKEAVFNVDLTILEIDILTAEEKKQLLFEFNQFNRTQTGQDHLNKTLHGLFADQVEKTPDETSLIFIQQDQDPGLLTYRQLDEKAWELAFILKEKGFGVGQIAALLMESSIHMAVAVLAILNAGGAYLPIDVEAPQDRKMFTLKDSGVQLLLTGSAAFYPGIEGLQQLDISTESLYTHYTHSTHKKEHAHDHEIEVCTPGDPAYVIYTSGSTGRPKGVIVEHRQAVNTLVCRKEEYHLKPGHTALQLFSYAFDGFITGFFTPLISGARLILLSKETIQDISRIIDVITAFKVTHFISVPILFQAILSEMAEEKAVSLQVITLAGDKVSPRLLELAAAKNKQIEIVNEYGVTEAAVMSTIYRHQEKDRRIKIGRPIGNTSIYILTSDGRQQFAPIGVFGEMCIAGAGVARGYLNNPQLTAEKFEFEFNQEFNRSYGSYRTSIFYKTGDLARWLPDGNIEYRGRADFQVKVRGFRVELGEIERQLLTYSDIKESVVTALTNNDGDKYLCAYITANRQLSMAELREYLASRLPDYMIPAYFITLAKIPLSPNGKVDRNQLPSPAAAIKASEYTPPRDRLESQLVEIWANILGVAQDSIGIDSDFFELGGHSLTATILSTRIHKEFNIKIPMVEIFKSPKIKSLSKYITSSREEIFTSIPAVEKKEYYPVSSAQNRLYILHQMGFGKTAYNVPTVVELEGELKPDHVEVAFKKMISRYESLRTFFALIDEIPVQRILESSEVQFAIEYYMENNGNSRQSIQEIIAHFIRPFDLDQAPLLRVGLVKMESVDHITRHVLMVDMHHILTDVVSQNLLVISFISLYNGLHLPELKLQYKDYSEWQQRPEVIESLKQQELFWLKEFASEVPIINLPTDYPRPAIQSFEGDHADFEISAEEKKRLNEIAHSEGATMFMILLAIFNILLAKLSNQEEIVVGTPVIGRWHADLEQIIGIFLNMIALKNVPREELTFKDFLKQLKEKTLITYENQSYQFENLVQKVTLNRDTSRNPLFDVTFMFQNTFGTPADMPAQGMQNLKVKPYSFENKTSKYDLSLIADEEGEELYCGFEYSTRLFEKETIIRFIHYFKRIISSVISNPLGEISQIDILVEEEKERLLEVFNNTRVEYPHDQTIHRLFEDQADKTPYSLAVVFEDNSLTYKKLNDEANRLANYLISMKIKLEERVGIFMNRSFNILIAILGILKAGGAYVPIDSSLPEARIKYIIDDAEISVIISEKEHIKELNRLQWDCKKFHTFLCMNSTSVYNEDEVAENHLMNQEMWDSLSESAEDDITGGGWYSSYTGEPFSKKEMEEYSNNIFAKVTPWLHENSRILEIGCASGLSMYRLAPRVGFYLGTDLSPVIIEKNKKLVKEGDYQNISLLCLPAHEIDKLPEENFDMIILNSVIHYFHGHNYLRKVLHKAIDKLGPKGYIFLGDLMDQDLKDELITETRNFSQSKNDKNYRTKTNWSAELFISRSFLQDFGGEIPEINEIEFSRKIYTLENELTKFRYDALLKVDKSQTQTCNNKIALRNKYQHDRNTLAAFDCEKLTLDAIQNHRAVNLAYVTYTSGTTGVPKGIMIQHQSVSNFIKGITDIIDINKDDQILSLTTISFDIFGLEAIVPITKGARVILGNSDEQLNNTALIAALCKHKISIFQVTPSRLQLVFSDDMQPPMLEKIKYLLVGGEAFPEALLQKAKSLVPGKIYNLYGPTETTIWSTAKDMTHETILSIGKPIANTRIYIFGNRGALLPMGVAGELCIGGDGLARGYLHNDKLTAEKFIENPFISNERIYKTGDLARWLPDGNLEFLGRMDNQVKIRGFRIEASEIENRLAEMESVTQVVVIDKQEENGEKYLCAFLTANKDISAAEARDFLAQTLPGYMIPSYFVQLEVMPLTANGKIDRKALPSPILQGRGEYIEPGDMIEKILARIWCEELGLEKVSIDENFFHLGGQSLKATTMSAKVHKELNVKVSIIDVFKYPTIRGLAQFIKGNTENKYESIKAIEVKKYYDVTHSQKRLWVLSHVRESSLTFNLSYAYLLGGRINKEVFLQVFKTLVERHESLRTVFITIENKPMQKILSLAESGFTLEYIDLREMENKELKAHEYVEAELEISFDLMKGPLLRAKLIQLEEEKHLFLFTMHHIISDNFSMEVLFKEILIIYDRYLEGKENPLKPLRIQYKDYAHWQNEQLKDEKMQMLQNYWFNQMQGELPILAFPTDKKRPQIKGHDGDIYSFYINDELTGQLRKLSERNEVTLFMTLLASINVLLYRYTGQTDIIVGTPVSGREHADLQDQIGFYINTLALRTCFNPGDIFESLLKKVKKVALGAFENQAYPFDELLENLGIKRDLSRHPLFDVMISMLKGNVFDEMPQQEMPQQTALQIIPFDSKYSKSKFDMTFYIFEGDNSLKINVEYNVDLFTTDTISRMCKRFQILVNHIVKNPGGNISEFPIEEEVEFSAIRPITRARRSE